MTARGVIIAVVLLISRFSSAAPFDELRARYASRGEAMYVTSIWIEDMFQCLEDDYARLKDTPGVPRLRALLLQYRAGNRRAMGLLVLDLKQLVIRYKTSLDRDAALLDVMPSISSTDFKNIALFIERYIGQDARVQTALDDAGITSVGVAVAVTKAYIDDPLVSKARKRELLLKLQFASITDEQGLEKLKRTDPEAYKDIATYKSYKLAFPIDADHFEVAGRPVEAWSKEFATQAAAPP